MITGTGGKVRLTRRDRELLRELAASKECMPTWNGWTTPMYLGGRDGSHHSQTLAKFCRLGLAKSKPRGGYSRGSKLYRITDAGRAALDDAKEKT